MNNSKIALVTGASSGIGQTTVMSLLQEGYIVYGAARRTEKMEILASKGARIIAMDVTKDESIVAGITQIIKEEGKIDILINNAGYGSYGAIEDVPIEEAKRQFEVNVFGLARLTQLVLPYMRSNNFGKIINISSIAGKIYMPLGGWYVSSKHALEGFSDCLRLEVAKFGIDVIIIEPGPIKTEWDGIALDSAEKMSGKTAYSDMVTGLKKLFKQMNQASPPEVISNTILKALRAKRPRTRYVAGNGAKPLMVLHSLISNKMYDAIMHKMM